MRLSRAITVDASSDMVWELLADAYSLPRWWPNVQRVEGVSDTHFTEVVYTKKGKPVRIDFHYSEVDSGRVLAWEQEVIGSPFERLLSLWSVRVTLVPQGGGATTLVDVEEEQRFRGSFRFGAVLQRRAARKRIDTALTNLSGLFSA